MSSMLKRLHEDYRTRQKKLTAAVMSVRVLILIVFVGLWELAGRLGWIDVLLFSYPSKLWNQLYTTTLDGTLPPHIAVTVMETAAGFVLGTLLGAALAALLWWYPFFIQGAGPLSGCA